MHNYADGRAPADLSDEQRALVVRIVDDYVRSAPQGWVRIVSREECSADEQSAGIAAVRVAVSTTGDGLVADLRWSPPRTLFFETGDLLRELAAASSTRCVTFSVLLDRDGRREVELVEDEPRLLVGDRDPARPVHRHLELHRDELEALAARLG